MRTVFILMDSLNRRYLSVYGNEWMKTPGMDRLASHGIVFDNHFAGSTPCIPARREMMTGRYNFLEAPWGPIEPWDDCLPLLLKQERQTYSHMITDHYHYFHSGGEAYHTLFSSWEFQRGQEHDNWRPLVNPVPPPAGARGKGLSYPSYWKNRASMDSENDLDYSAPQCFQRGIDYLENNKDADNWHLHLEVFDPHEPFDCPQRYRDLYDDDWTDYHYTWPEYQPLDTKRDTPEAVAHIRKSYAGTLTMTDHWLGKFLDKMDELELWEDTTVILTADHGYLLGEHGYWAKDYTMNYAELANIPLIVCPAGGSSGRQRVSSLTGAIDIMPTIMDLHGLAVPQSVHGSSLTPLITGSTERLHDAVLYGTFGKDINLTDGRYTYCRQPSEGATVHHHTAMPRGFWDFLERDHLRAAEMGVFLDHCHGIPHYRIARPSRRHADATDYNPIYDLEADPGQLEPIRDPALEARLAELMRKKLAEAGAPAIQYDRVGLKRPG